MGGKRPDQYRIDPSEGQSTDNKWGPGHADEHIKDEDKAKYQLSREEDEPDSKIPPAGMNPALRELRAVKAETRREEAEEREASGDEDRRSDR